jgi:hypothetical protein
MNLHEWKTFQGYVFKNDEKKIFFPMYGHHLIARTCLKMFSKYPHLSDSYDDIFDHEYRIDEWLDEPITKCETDLLYLKHLLSEN